MKIKPKEGQSYIDLTLQTSGSIDALLAMSLLNDICITDDIDYENIEPVDAVRVLSQPIVDKYAIDDINPATALTLEDLQGISGIGYMGIEIDFIIN